MKMVDNKSWYKKLGIAMNEADFQKKCETVYGEEGTRLANAIRLSAKNLPGLQFKIIETALFHASASWPPSSFPRGPALKATRHKGRPLGVLPLRQVAFLV